MLLRPKANTALTNNTATRRFSVEKRRLLMKHVFPKLYRKESR